MIRKIALLILLVLLITPLTVARKYKDASYRIDREVLVTFDLEGNRNTEQRIKFTNTDTEAIIEFPIWVLFDYTPTDLKVIFKNTEHKYSRLDDSVYRDLAPLCKNYLESTFDLKPCEWGLELYTIPYFQKGKTSGYIHSYKSRLQKDECHTCFIFYSYLNITEEDKGKVTYGDIKLILKIPKKKDQLINIFDTVLLSDFNRFPDEIFKDSEYNYYVWNSPDYQDETTQNIFIRIDYKYKSNWLWLLITVISATLIVWVFNKIFDGIWNFRRQRRRDS